MNSNEKETESEKPVCGIIMPISGNESYRAEHWLEVKKILEEVIVDVGISAEFSK
jgi:hypothetical protein